MTDYYLDKLLDKYNMRNDTYSKVMYALMALIIIAFVWLVIIRVPSIDNILIKEKEECIASGKEMKHVFRGYRCMDRNS